MVSVVGIIQARIGSSRLKNKMIFDLNGYKIIEWVLYRVKKSKLLDKIILALPDSNDNDILADIGKKYKYEIFRGSESDVLSRFYLAAKKFNSDTIVRICADNPLIDPAEIDNLIEFFNNSNNDYAYNHRPWNNEYPDGIGAEIVNFSTLEWLYYNTKNPKNREHIFNFILENPSKFQIQTFDPKNKNIQRPDLKFDIDTIEDYNYLNSKKYTMDITTEELIKIFG